jgi:hypothetical protein
MRAKQDFLGGALPTKSLVIKGEKCTGDKMSKERLAVLDGRNVKASRDWKSSKTKIFQEPKN